MSTRTRRVGVAVALALLLVLAGCNGLGGGQGGGAPVEAGGGDAGRSGDAPRDAEPSSGGVATGGSFYADGRRVVVREARLRVRVEDYSAAFDRARAAARRQGGFVADWDRETEGDWDRGTLVVRVPAGNFSAARDAVAGLGTVESERVRQRDFTVAYADAGDRLADLREEKRAVEDLLNRTDDPEAVQEIRADLRRLRERITELERERARIERREALSTIRLTLAEPVDRKPPQSRETAFGFRDAFLEAFFGGLAAVKYLIVAFGYLIPVGVAGLFAGVFLWSLARVGALAKSRVDALLPGPAPGPDDGCDSETSPGSGADSVPDTDGGGSSDQGSGADARADDAGGDDA